MNRTAHTAQIQGASIDQLTEWGRQAFAAISSPAPASTMGGPLVATGQLWLGLKRVFATLTNDGENFALLPCSANGQPAGLIVCYRLTEKGVEVAPLFVSLVPGMTIINQDGDILFDQATA